MEQEKVKVRFGLVKKMIGYMVLWAIAFLLYEFLGFELVVVWLLTLIYSDI